MLPVLVLGTREDPHVAEEWKASIVFCAEQHASLSP
jgi:hypothetical protein